MNRAPSIDIDGVIGAWPIHADTQLLKMALDSLGSDITCGVFNQYYTPCEQSLLLPLAEAWNRSVTQAPELISLLEAFMNVQVW
jgi:hypothetical protein